MNTIDIENKLLKGSPIYLENKIPIYKLTLGDMADYRYGYSNLNKIINIICMSDEDASNYLKNIENKTTFTFIYIAIMQEVQENSEKKQENFNFDELLLPCMIDYLKLIFKKDVEFDMNRGFVIGSYDYILNDTNFDKFREIVKLRNCMSDIDDFSCEDNPSNEMARMLLEKRKKLRERLKKEKQKNYDEEDTNITILDLISIFAEAEHMTPQMVYENYDIYQFNNQFNRLKIMEDYQVNIKCLLAGAKDIEYRSFITKIPKNKETD